MSTPIVPSGHSFICTPTHVWDGDGSNWRREGPPVRLAGIAARELDETCCPSHPCLSTSGVEAPYGLVTLVGRSTRVGRHGHTLAAGSTMSRRSDGSAKGSRCPGNDGRILDMIESQLQPARLTLLARRGVKRLLEQTFRTGAGVAF